MRNGVPDRIRDHCRGTTNGIWLEQRAGRCSPAVNGSDNSSLVLTSNISSKLVEKLKIPKPIRSFECNVARIWILKLPALFDQLHLWAGAVSTAVMPLHVRTWTIIDLSRPMIRPRSLACERPRAISSGLPGSCCCSVVSTPSEIASVQPLQRGKTKVPLQTRLISRTNWGQMSPLATGGIMAAACQAEGTRGERWH
jgi:hypothetical protein